MRFLLPQTRREDTFVAKTALRARPSIGRRQLRVRADVRVSLTDGLAAPSGADLSFYRHVYHQAYARPPSFSFFRVHARGHGCLTANPRSGSTHAQSAAAQRYLRTTILKTTNKTQPRQIQDPPSSEIFSKNNQVAAALFEHQSRCS